MRCYFLRPLITADLLDQWFGPQAFSQHIAGSAPGSVRFPSAGRRIYRGDFRDLFFCEPFPCWKFLRFRVRVRFTYG